MKFDATNNGLTAHGQIYQQVAATTTVVKSGAGRLARIIVVAGTGAVTAYDNTAGSGTILWTKTTVAVGDIYEIDIPAATGITVVVAAATTVNVVYT